MADNNRPNVLSASTIKGKNVVNNKGEDIGEVHELMIDMGKGRISYAVLQFGGFMGLGDKLFAIPWEAFSVDADEDRFILNVDKQLLEEAEGFDQDNWPDTANYQWLQDTYDYYGYEPYW